MKLDVDGQGMRRFARLHTMLLAGGLALATGAGLLPAQMVKAPRYQSPVDAPVPQLTLPALPPAITPHGTVVEDIVVRVNDQIISRSDVTRQQQQLVQDAARGNAPKEEMALQEKNMLRDMIDQQLLLSRAKELGLNADADVIRQLDEIRKQNKMTSMDELQRAAQQQGISFEDFKAQIRNQMLTQQVVREEVGRRLQLSRAEETKYYEEHKDEFKQEEQIRLSEILVPLPENATAAEIAQAEVKANDLKATVQQGADFAETAKKSSGGPSAAQGGDLGLFKRGTLPKVFEDEAFPLPVGSLTKPIRSRQGYVILKVTEHAAAGVAPMKDVSQQIEEAIYMQHMQPALRAYLTKLRSEAYVDIQPGFVDSGASGTESKPIFTAYAPPPVKKKTVKTKARFDRNRAYASAPRKAVVASPDTTGTRTLTGADASTSTSAGVDPATGLAVISAPPKVASGKAPKAGPREKIRFGQAPRNAIPAGTDDTVASDGVVAPGAVMASNGTQAPAIETANLQDNPLTARAPEKAKTRFAAKAKEQKDQRVVKLSAKQQEKILAKPVAMTADEKAAAQAQGAPLGLSGDTSKKPAKVKKVKGAPKERMQTKPVESKPAPEPVAPTANPNLAPTNVSPSSTSAPPATTPPTT